MLSAFGVGATGCTPTSAPPSAEDAAAYLGLQAERQVTFDVGGGASEVHTVQASSVLVQDALVFDVIARSSSGFSVPERTWTIAVDAASARLVRFSDCISSCRQPASPVAFLDVPVDSGSSVETEVGVTVTDNTGAETAVQERHVFLVADAAEVETPSGTYEAHPVTWTRVIEGAVQTAVLYLAPDTGVVGWDGFDGTRLRLAP